MYLHGPHSCKPMMMNRTEFVTAMQDFNFERLGEILRIDGFPTFRLGSSKEGHGFVYLWVEFDGQAYRIVYVGKAGKSVNGRCAQHFAGFKKGNTGKKHAARFMEGFEKNCEYLLYARKSGDQEVLGQPGVSMACVEELAFIKKFKQLWNSL